MRAIRVLEQWEDRSNQILEVRLAGVRSMQ
jgi:hypothetical protein